LRESEMASSNMYRVHAALAKVRQTLPGSDPDLRIKAIVEALEDIETVLGSLEEDVAKLQRHR
jgi:hypothetical protein